MAWRLVYWVCACAASVHLAAGALDQHRGARGGRLGEVHPNDGGTLAPLFTVRANDREDGPGEASVAREIERVSRMIGLPKPATQYFGACEILHPRHFGRWGGAGGALWRSCRFHGARSSNRGRPWLWRVGALVHPGGGIAAVLGGAMISTDRLLRRLGETKGTE